MRALVLGQTGVEKGRFLEGLVAHARRHRGLPESEEDKYAFQYARAYQLEEEIKAHGNIPTIQPFLDSLSAKGRLETWREVMKKRVLDPLEKTPAEHVFLSAHGFFYRNNHYFTAIDWPSLEAFEPTIVLTLIDDCYDVASRVSVVREKEGPRTQSEITLLEALTWRSVEISVGDLIARSLSVPHFVIPVKQPMETAHRLLLEPDVLRLYASFPISSTRKVPDRIREINQHRALIHEKYTVFDPVCIDELRLVREDQSSEILGRWPLNPVEPSVPAEEDFAPAWEEELRALEPVISAQIEERDYRLIDQSQALVAYRPFWGEKEYPAQGVEKEISHALASNRPVYYYDPPEDAAGRKGKVFKVIERGIGFDSLDEMYSELDKVQSELR